MEQHGRFLAFRLARSQLLGYYHLPLQHARPSYAKLAKEDSDKAEASPATSSRCYIPAEGDEDERGSRRERPAESCTQTSPTSSGNIGPAFFISRRPDQTDVISPQLIRTAFQLFQKSTLEPGGTLDRRRFEVFEAVQRASTSSVWYTR